jgi:hypothetical protein
MLARRFILKYAAECHVRLCPIVVMPNHTRYTGRSYNILIIPSESAVDTYGTVHY